MSKTSQAPRWLPGVPPPKNPQIPWVPWDMLVYAPNPPPEVNEAWRVVKALLVTLRNEVVARGAKFAVFVVNGPWAHYDNHWHRMMARHPIGLRTWDRRKPNRTIGAFLWEQHIPSVDLFDAFEEAKDHGLLFFKFDPHWTALGHQIAANTVAHFLIRQRLVPVASLRGMNAWPTERLVIILGCLYRCSAPCDLEKTHG